MIKRIVFSTLMLIGVNCFADGVTVSGPTHDIYCACTAASQQNCSCTGCNTSSPNSITGSCNPDLNMDEKVKMHVNCPQNYTPVSMSITDDSAAHIACDNSAGNVAPVPSNGIVRCANGDALNGHKLDVSEVTCSNSK